MATADTVKAQLRSLIDSANAKTGKADQDLTTAVSSLAAGYGLGSDPVLTELTVTENGEYLPGEGVDGFSKVVANVAASGGGAFTPQTGSFVPTAATESISITLNDDIPDNFLIFTILHDKNVETFINAGVVAEARLHYNGKFMIIRGASSTTALLTANRHTVALDGSNDPNGTYSSYNATTRTLNLGAYPNSGWYLLQYDYCIVPYDGIDMAGWMT